MNFMRLVASILVCIITAKSVIADPLQHIIACHHALPADKKHLSPIYGLALLDSPWLANLRFFGSYGKEDKDSPFQRFEQLNRAKDHPKSATAALIQHLFPSPADNLAITGQASFLFRQLSMEGLAELVMKLEGFKDNEAELIKFLEKNVSSASYKKQFKKKKKFAEYAKLLQEANLEASKDPFSASPNLVQHLLIAYACERARRSPQNDFHKFLEKIAPGSETLAQQYQPIDKQGYLDWKSNLEIKNEGKQLVISGPHLQQLLNDPLLAYQLSQACLKYEQLPLQINYSTARVDGVEFSDCCESGLRGLVLFFLYDPETNTLDLSRIPDTATTDFKEFFTEYDPLNPIKFHSKWAALLANRADQRIIYKNVVGNTRCELESGIKNCLRVLAELLGEPKLAQDDINLVDRVKLLELLFTKGESRYDLDNEEDFDAPETVDELLFLGDSFAFKFESAPGHTGTEFENRYVLPKPVFVLEDLIHLKDQYLPFYANFFPDLLGLPSTINTSDNQQDLNYGFAERRKAIFDNLLGDKRDHLEVIYKLLLSNTLIPTDSKLAFIKTVLDLGLFGMCEKLPALNHRLALCDPYTNMELLLALSQQSEEVREQSFPKLWHRLTRVIKDRSLGHLMVVGRLPWDSYRRKGSLTSFYDACLSKEVLESAVQETLESDEKIGHLSRVVWMGTSFRDAGTHNHERLLDAFHPLFPRLMRIVFNDHYPALGGDFKSTFASSIFANGNWVTEKMPIRFLSYLGDQEFEELAYQENQDISFRSMVAHSSPEDLANPNLINAFYTSGLDYPKFRSYLIERLYQINPQRLKDFTFCGSHVLLYAMRYRSIENAPIVKFLLEKYGDDRQWVLKPNDEGKTCLDFIYTPMIHDVDINKCGDLFTDFYVQIKDHRVLKALVRRNLLGLTADNRKIEALEKAMQAAHLNAPEVLDDSINEFIFSQLRSFSQNNNKNMFIELQKLSEQYIPDFYQRKETKKRLVSMFDPATSPSVTPLLMDMFERLDFEGTPPDFSSFPKLLDVLLDHPDAQNLTERFFAWQARYPEFKKDFFNTVIIFLRKSNESESKDKFSLLIDLAQKYSPELFEGTELFEKVFHISVNGHSLSNMIDILERLKVDKSRDNTLFYFNLSMISIIFERNPNHIVKVRFDNWLMKYPEIALHLYSFNGMMDE